jgi:hypothetical protein
MMHWFNYILISLGIAPSPAFALAGFEGIIPVPTDDRPELRICKGKSAPSVKRPKMPTPPRMPAPAAPNTSGIEALLRQQNRVTNRLGAQMKRDQAASEDRNQQMQASLLAAMPPERELPTVEPTPPPPTMSLLEVQNARDQVKRDAGKRKGMRKSVVAGETGGYRKSMLG